MMRRAGLRASRLALWLTLSAACAAGVASTGAAEASEPIHAVVRSANDVTIGSDAGSRILTIPLREGEPFHKGELLVSFDCARTRAEWKSAEAEWHGHLLAYQNDVSLQKYHAAGNNDVLIAKAQVDKAAAAVEGWAARVDQCEVRAPFDGRVADVFAHVFDLPSPSSPILRIVDPAHLEVEMIVPSRAVSRIKLGDGFALVLEETGEVVNGRVVRIGAAVDPVSETMKVVGALAIGAADGSRGAVLPGMSGKADFGTIF